MDVEPEAAFREGRKQKVDMKKTFMNQSKFKFPLTSVARLGLVSMKLTFRLLVACSLAIVPMAAKSAITIDVTPSSAPNGWGSPSFSGYAANAIYALENGLTSYGDPGSPSYYTQAPAVMSVLDNIVTDFSSWNGVANPTGAYASELGNRLHFGLDVRGNGSLISISELSFSATSTDANSLGFSYSAGEYDYNASYVGWNYGTDGIRGTLDDTFITSGPNTQQVDEIVSRGSGNAWAVYVGGYPGTLQDGINQAAADLGSSPIDFTGTYTLGGAQGSATVTFEPVPEPTTAGCFLLGLGTLACLHIFAQKRRS